jgi:pyruvate formate lyase activating enzyme
MSAATGTLEELGRKEAMLWEPLPHGKVRCNLCAHRCVIRDGRLGVCGVRLNQGGVLYTLVYGKAIAHHVDPIEKKPLFHFFPGSRSFSIATVGCNFRCSFCQNWDISQLSKISPQIEGYALPPEEVVQLARESASLSIAYTYTEPTIFYEYAYDTARLAQSQGIRNLFVTNGYMTAEALEAISPYLDAANVDLKSFRQSYYLKVVGGRLASVLESLRLMKKLNIWVEVTTLLIPGENDSEDELRDIAEFVCELGPETPWHISRFFPAYKMLDVPPTPISKLRRARDIGKEAGLRYVYIGNVPSDHGEDTFCYQCGALVIRRVGFSVLSNALRGGCCPECGTPIDGLGMDWRSG